MLKTLESLQIKCLSFSELKENWGGYNENEVTIQSIHTANKLLENLSKVYSIADIDVFPMRDGGVQIEIGDWLEIEIYDYTITKIKFDENGTPIDKITSQFKD